MFQVKKNYQSLKCFTFFALHYIIFDKPFLNPSLALFLGLCDVTSKFVPSKYNGILNKILNGDPNSYFMFSK